METIFFAPVMLIITHKDQNSKSMFILPEMETSEALTEWHIAQHPSRGISRVLADTRHVSRVHVFFFFTAQFFRVFTYLILT